MILQRVSARAWRIASFLAATLTVSAVCGTASASQVRELTVYNIHNKELTTTAFKRDGEYIPEGLKKLNWIFRDWRKNEPTNMDPGLFDLLWTIHRDLGSKKPINLISGYRSPGTNAMLRKTVGGQAKRSQHMLGKASDVRFPDIPLAKLRASAMIRQSGGVGYYPKSGVPFCHIDVAWVRHWPRMSRSELGLLFPSGHSKHIPADGRPLTLADARAAEKKYPEKAYEIAQMRAHMDMPGSATMLASLTPPLVKDAINALTGGKERTATRPTIAPPARSLQLASADLSAPVAPAHAPLPKPARRQVASALPVSAGSDELTFAPVSGVRLMSVRSVSGVNPLTALTHPQIDQIAFTDGPQDGPVAARIATGSAFQYAANDDRFTGTVVRQIASDTTAPAPRRHADAGQALRPFRTAALR